MTGSKLAGRRAVVTGGTRGIGAAIVGRLRGAGAEVLFTGRNRERGNEVARLTGARFLQADAADVTSATRIVDAMLTAFDGIDVFVNNAGGPGQRGGVSKPESLQEAIDVHLAAAWRLTARIAPVMTAAGGGSIILMASLAAHRLGAVSMAYSVAKAGLVHFARCAAAELGAGGVRVNSVSPGFIETEIHGDALGLGAERARTMTVQLGKIFVAKQFIPSIGQPENVADVVAFLASDEAAFVTGADIIVDGGLMWGQAASKIQG